MNQDGSIRHLVDEDLMTMEHIDCVLSKDEIEDSLEIKLREMEKFRRRKENKVIR